MSHIATMVRRLPLAAAVLLLAGCAGVTPIGELLDNSSRYDGKTVRVKGEVQRRRRRARRRAPTSSGTRPAPSPS